MKKKVIIRTKVIYKITKNFNFFGQSISILRYIKFKVILVNFVMASENGSATAMITSTNEDHSLHYPKLLEAGLSVTIANALDSVFKDGEFKITNSQLRHPGLQNARTKVSWPINTTFF